VVQIAGKPISASLEFQIFSRGASPAPNPPARQDLLNLANFLPMSYPAALKILIIIILKVSLKPWMQAKIISF